MMAYERLSKRVRSRGLLVAALVTSALPMLLVTPAQATQPDPFEDHERGEMAPEALPEDDAPPLPAEPGTPAKEPAPPSAEAPADKPTTAQYAFQQWHWSLGAGTQFSYTGTTNEVLVGNDQTNRTLFLTLAPRGSLFVIDNVEVALSVGLLTKLSAREGGDSVTDNNFFFEASGHYHIPIATSPFAFIPGLGMGGYFGASSRELRTTGGTLDESTSTQGFLINGYLGVGYHASESWRLSSGLTVGGLFGSEKLKSQDTTLGVSAAHIGLPLEVVYVF